MTVNVLDEMRGRGVPIDKQYRSWSDFITEPYNKREVDAFTRSRIYLMGALEAGSLSHTHTFTRFSANDEIRNTLAMIRRAEHQQQTTLNYLIPGDETVMERTIAWEQMMVELTAYCARSESEPYVKQVFNYILLDDFDHLYRFCELMDMVERRDPNEVLQYRTEIHWGRATSDGHLFPTDEIKHSTNCRSVSPLTTYHILTLLNAKRRNHNFYLTQGNHYTHQLARQVFSEIAEIEEQHIGMLETLFDPTTTFLELELLNHSTEAFNYYNFCQDETDPRIRRIWNDHYYMELEHMRIATEFLGRYEGKSATDVISSHFPESIRFTSNKDYISWVLGTQVGLRSVGRDFASRENVPGDWCTCYYTDIVNAKGNPSEQVVHTDLNLPRHRYDLSERAGVLAWV